MPVEVLSSPVVDRGRARIGVACGELDISQRHTGVEGSHDECAAKHVWMNVSEAGTLADRSHPSMCGAAVEALAVVADQDRSFTSLADCASKGGVLLLMKSLAVELAGEGIRVNCVCPGGVDTALREQAAASLHNGANTRLFARTQETMPGLIPPSDVARAIAYLASEDAASITGASLVVDRGVLF